MKNNKIQILIADDHDLIRQGLKSIVALEDDIEVVAEANNGEKVIEMYKLHKPDIILIDLNMPVLNGVKAIEEIRKTDLKVKIIVITIETGRKIIHEVINAGADGYILKESAGTEVVSAIKSVINGDKYIDKSLISILFSEIKDKNEKANNVLDLLSKRELEVLFYISKGLSNKEVGKQLFLSEKTVKNYTTNLFRKLTANDRVHATIIALESRIEDYYNTKYQ